MVKWVIPCQKSLFRISQANAAKPFTITIMSARDQQQLHRSENIFNSEHFQQSLGEFALNALLARIVQKSRLSHSALASFRYSSLLKKGRF